MLRNLTPQVPTRQPGCPTALALEEFVAQRRDPKVEAHAFDCKDCGEYVRRLREEAQAFVASRPADRFLAQLSAAASKRTAAPRIFVRAATLTACLAGGVLWLALPRSSPRDDAVRLKGAERLTVYVQRAGQVHPVSSGEDLASHDALRFTWNAEAAGYAEVFEQDGTGVVTAVAPFEGGPAPVAAGSNTLPDSAVLDATPGPERLTAVFSPIPFSVSSVREALAAGKAPAGQFVFSTLEFKKRR